MLASRFEGITLVRRAEMVGLGDFGDLFQTKRFCDLPC